jgi:hypothetical protein
MNNSSLFTADRTTHLKIVVTALVCATLVAGVGIAARITEATPGINGRLEMTGPVKAPKPVTASTSENRTVR